MAKGEIALDGRRVAVTGAGGFIGNALCRRLAEGGATVVGLELDGPAAERVLGAGAELAICDVADPSGVADALEGVDLVIHTAAIVSDWGSMEDFVRVNVGGTVNVLDAAEATGAERVVHVSSVVVHGYDDPSEQDEDCFRRAYGIPYIDTKSASDRIACRRGAVVVRPGDVYGPGSVPWTIRTVELAKAGPVAVVGEGPRWMLPVYVDDLVEGIVLALRRGTPGTPYVVWQGTPVSFEDYFNGYARMAGARRARRVPRRAMIGLAGAMELAARLRHTDPAFSRNAVTIIDRHGTISTRRAREELGWEPVVDLDEGMRRTEEWLRAEGLL